MKNDVCTTIILLHNQGVWWHHLKKCSIVDISNVAPFVYYYIQWGRNETFLREYLFNKVFWNYEFSAKNISTFHKFKGVTGLRYSLVPPSLQIFLGPYLHSTYIQYKEGVKMYSLDLHNAVKMSYKKKCFFSFSECEFHLMRSFSCHIDRINRGMTVVGY